MAVPHMEKTSGVGRQVTDWLATMLKCIMASTCGHAYSG